MAITILNAKTDLGAVGKGGSGSHYYLCEDKNVYIVKFFDAIQKTTINELVAGSLAMKIKLPTPDIAMINLPEFMILESKEDVQTRKIEAGLHIGFKKLPEKTWDYEYWKTNMLESKDLVNTEDLYGVVSFDNWVLNTDRNNEGNNMFELLEENKIRYWMVDFGHCFLRNNWTEQELRSKKDEKEIVDVLQYVRNKITKFDDFLKWFDVIEQFDDHEIEYIVNIIPSNWPISKDEKNLLIEILKHRKTLARRNISDNKEKFSLGV